MLACIIKQPRSKLLSFINIEFCLYLSLRSSLKLWSAVMKEVDPELFFGLFCFNGTNKENRHEIWWIGIIINKHIFVWLKPARTLRGVPKNVHQHQLHTPEKNSYSIVVAATSNSQNNSVIIFLANSEQEYFSNTSIHQSVRLTNFNREWTSLERTSSPQRLQRSNISS